MGFQMSPKTPRRRFLKQCYGAISNAKREYALAFNELEVNIHH